MFRTGSNIYKGKTDDGKDDIPKVDSVIKLHIFPELGNIELRKFNTVLISDFAQAKLQHGRKDKIREGLSPNTVCDILTILKGILDYAYSEKFIENPVRINPA
ncbi:MAG: hypothetical protein FWC47_00945 [Oscillospiraceae bacterium]|nr:hypothetical protein [Oscillospiraceae bacterium]